jgi:hypothetical protein
MSEELNPKEKEILRLLFHTYKRNANTYLDLIGAMSNYHPDEIRSLVNNMHARQMLYCMPSADGTHVLCRITENGINALNQYSSLGDKIKQNKKVIGITVGILLIIGVIIDMNTNIASNFLMGSVAGLNVSEKSKTILADWIENAEQENSDYYTFSLSDKEGSRRTYLVECKTEYADQCKYSIVFVTLDEDTEQLLSVEVPWSE